MHFICKYMNRHLLSIHQKKSPGINPSFYQHTVNLLNAFNLFFNFISFLQAIYYFNLHTIG